MSKTLAYGSTGCRSRRCEREEPVGEVDPVNGEVAIGQSPEVMFIDEMAHILRTSRSTIERRRRAGTFPIPELPSIDERPRWSRQAVEAYLVSSNQGMRPRQGRSRRVRVN